MLPTKRRPSGLVQPSLKRMPGARFASACNVMSSVSPSMVSRYKPDSIAPIRPPATCHTIHPIFSGKGPARRNPGVDIGPEQRRPLNVDPVQHLFDRVPQRTLAHQGSLLTDAVYPAHSCCLRCHGHLTKSVALSAIAETWAVADQKRIKRRAISRETTDSTRKPRARGRVTSGRRLCSAPSSFRRFPSTNGPRISPNTSGGRG